MQIEDGKKELIYYKEVDVVRLIEELYEAIPELKPIVLNNNKFKVNLRMFTNGNKLTLWIREDVQDIFVNQVIENHVLIIEKEGDE